MIDGHGHGHGKGLKQNNIRMTKGCKKVLEALEQFEELSSAQDIHGKLRTGAGDAPGLTTIYRSLESLVGMGLVQSVDLGDGERRYELVKPGEHHHHLVCQGCRSSVHLDQCLIEEFEGSIRQKYGFLIKGHILEIFGLCKDCHAKG